MLSFFITGPSLILCILIYKPPTSVLIEFLSIVMPKYDRVLILGDFNIDVFCLYRLLTSLNLLKGPHLRLGVRLVSLSSVLIWWTMKLFLKFLHLSIPFSVHLFSNVQVI